MEIEKKTEKWKEPNDYGALQPNPNTHSQWHPLSVGKSRRLKLRSQRHELEYASRSGFPLT